MLRKLLVALSMPCAVLAQTPADRWNLADVYATEAAWQEDTRRLEGQFDEMKTCRGQLGESPARFKACMDLNTDLYKRFRRLSTYASETFAENTAAPAGMELRQKARLLGSRTEESVAFVRPEILALGPDRVARLLAGDAALAIYRRPLDVVLRNAPHTLDDAGESMAATFGLATSAPESVYTTLSNADMLWPSVKLSNGQVARLDQSGYTKYRAVANRADRKKVFDTFWRTWKDYERTFGVTFDEMLKTDSAYAKVRRYPGLDHAQARSVEDSVGGLRHADRADEREPADAAPVLQAAREDARRARHALLRHLSAARQRRSQVSARARQAHDARVAGAARRGLLSRSSSAGSRNAGWTPIRGRRSSRARTSTAVRTTCIRSC
jgi:hypothetical protein